jgi:isoquinoline 1-oxidoreductase alpha subunit
MKYQLSINSEQHDVDVEEDTPLLWVLRDTLNMTGTKFGCGVAACGACTVHLNGTPVRSCQLPVGQIQAGAKIDTIEMMANKTEGVAIQQAWIEHQVPQCGYCQSGQIMSASALIRDNANPSDKEIDTAMNGNICRCGTYKQIRAAISSAASTRGNNNA